MSAVVSRPPTHAKYILPLDPSNSNRTAQNQNNDQNIGSSQDQDPGGSATQVLSTLAPVALFALVWAVLFIIFRKWFARNYRPRT